jgi:predicted dehydrogenase/threonine dehydrogenase-like Zn-dependent dehydrogenase
MRQILQNFNTGETFVIDAPRPNVSAGKLLISTSVTLVSAGTERMLIDFAKANYLDKAKQQPEKLRQVLDKVKTDGLLTTIDAVISKLKEPIALGYCNVGTVLEVGGGVEGFKVGDRVLSNGAHAEIVNVPANLCAKIPDGVADETAVFGVLASIGLQGIRLANPTLGESVVVIGAGLIGLLTVQILRANGCRVLAIDFNSDRLAIAAAYGASVCNLSIGEDPVAAGLGFSGGVGVDAVLITASTKTSDPVSQAARMSRKRGRIILVGVAGLEINRSEFYEKELSFQVSCSYGPGRYDPSYEEDGNDYPIGFVRWTVRRNFEAVLELMERGGIDTSRLLTHSFPVESAPEAYACLTSNPSALGILLRFTSPKESRVDKLVALSSSHAHSGGIPKLSFIGAGNYASRKLVPAFRRTGAHFITIASANGLSAVVHGSAAGFENASSDMDSVIRSKESDTIVIATRHDSHALYVEKVLLAGKNVFVEKPLATTLEQLSAIQKAYEASITEGQRMPLLMVGFNRRFSPLTIKMKRLLESVHAPKTFIVTVNAGAISAKHWTQKKEIGGGRIIGEACHFIDLLRFLAGAPIVDIQCRRIGESPFEEVTEDKASITLSFADGSMGTIHYFANGAASFPKERIEAFVAGRILQIENFRVLRGFGWPGFRRIKLWRQDKGQDACAAAFVESIRTGGPSPIPADELFEIARVTIEVAEKIRLQ